MVVITEAMKMPFSNQVVTRYLTLLVDEISPVNAKDPENDGPTEKQLQNSN